MQFICSSIIPLTVLSSPTPTTDELLAVCRAEGLRVTTALRAVLETLGEAGLPQSLADLEAHPKLAKSCDRTTIFRTLQRLENIGLLRRLNFSERGAKFTLKTGKAHKEYLICESCGEVSVLDIACPVHKLEQDLMEQTGFKGLHHELEFYGTCPDCAA